jgi:hypothetical protein
MRILVLEALGLHLGYLGCYGNDWVATPNLDRLAADGIVFDSHFAERPEFSNDHGVRIVHCHELVDFADRVLAASAATSACCWVEGPSLLPPWTLDDDLLNAYFDEDDEEEGLTPWRKPPLECMMLDDAAIVRLQNTYAAVVTFFDAQIGKIIEHFPDADRALVCVTARFGLPLGEHGMIGTPRPRLHDELVHVPLVMRLPEGAGAGQRIAALTQPADLVAALDQPNADLWRLIRGEVEVIRPFAVSTLRVGDEECRLVRTPTRALHVPSDPTAPRLLFIKPEDRWEVNNLYQHEIEDADAMEKELEKFIRDGCHAAGGKPD